MLLLYKIKDPGLRDVTIIKVKVTDDLKRARVFFSCPDASKVKAEQAMIRAKGFIRSHLASQLQMRYVPDLLFLYDTTAAEQEKMEKLFKEIASEHE